MIHCIWNMISQIKPVSVIHWRQFFYLRDRAKVGSSLADIDPMALDRDIKFDAVGGLSQHVKSLKEMIIFPLLYPEVFEKFHINPPRGVLFYGPPGKLLPRTASLSKLCILSANLTINETRILWTVTPLNYLSNRGVRSLSLPNLSLNRNNNAN